jgi:UDPglucose 6-dehydrogenase
MCIRRNITIIGSGYVGMSLAVLLSQKNDVIVLDIDLKRVNKINKAESTIEDNLIDRYLKKFQKNIRATTNKKSALVNADFILVATPTNFDEDSNYFDTSSVDAVIEDTIQINKSGLIVIKSTVPVGYTEKVREKYNTDRIVFSPEFLREGNALYDNLYPSRLIIGSKSEQAVIFSEMLKNVAKNKDFEVLHTGSSEAEAIKLFSNTYLAMRISFFNELDSFALAKNFNTEEIIDGVCLDPRVGQGYNNPSFGYGGYCLPKDTKQLNASYESIPQKLIKATIDSNELRKRFIAQTIMKNDVETVGVYRLAMKKNSDNFRESSIIDIMNLLKRKNLNIVIFEPNLNQNTYMNTKVIKSLKKFKNMSDIIICNRSSGELNDVSSKVYTRDIFGVD